MGSFHMEQNSVYARRFTGEGLTFDDVLLVPAESDVSSSTCRS